MLMQAPPDTSQPIFVELPAGMVEESQEAPAVAPGHSTRVMSDPLTASLAIASRSEAEEAVTAVSFASPASTVPSIPAGIPQHVCQAIETGDDAAVAEWVAAQEKAEADRVAAAKKAEAKRLKAERAALEGDDGGRPGSRKKGRSSRRESSTSRGSSKSPGASSRASSLTRSTGKK